MIIAFIIPVIALIFSFLLKSATGPYWQFPDPAYGYLASSLSLIKGFSPTFNYQPGVSVEILGGAVILLMNIGHSTAETVQRVLLNPDFYLNAINISMIAFAFVTSWLLGRYVYRQTNDKLAVLLSQLPVLTILSLKSYLFYTYVLPIIANVSPEPLLISVSNLFNLFVLKLFFTKEKKDEIWITILLGFICGLGIASKLTFISLLVLPIILCRGWLKLLFWAASVISCLLWTIPVIPHYAWMWHWIVRLATHQGQYGSGDQGFINPHLYVWGLQNILSICSLLILFSLGALIFNLRSMIKDPGQKGNYFILATAFSIAVQFLVIAKHYDDHYLVSAINLFSPLLVLFYFNIKKENLFFKSIVVLCMIILAIQSIGRILEYNKFLSGYTKEAVRFNNVLHNKYPGFILIGIYPMPMSNAEAAWFWGNDRDTRQQDELSSLYPQNFAYFSNNLNDYAPYVSGIYAIKQRVWADDLLASGAHVLFVAPTKYDFSQTPYTVLPLEQGKYATAFLLVKSTEKQADIFFDHSLDLMKTGDYIRAFAFALKSKELHYQPDGKVTLLLSWIYLHIKH